MNNNDEWKALMREQQRKHLDRDFNYYAGAFLMAVGILIAGFGFAIFVSVALEALL